MADPNFLNPVTVLADIGGIAIDKTSRISEVYDNIITQNPIENGSPTTDHITNLPPRITLEGGFSDIRITKLIGTLGTQDSIRGRAKREFDKLLSLYTSRQTFLLMDGLHLFRDMQFKSLELIKDKPGFALRFSAEIWNIIVIDVDKKKRLIQSEEDSRNRLKVLTQGQIPVGGIPTQTSTLPSGIII